MWPQTKQVISWKIPPKQCTTVKPVLSSHSKIDKTKDLKTDCSLMKVESIAECSPWSILQYFWHTLSDNRSWKPIFGLFERPLKTGFTVVQTINKQMKPNNGGETKRRPYNPKTSRAKEFHRLSHGWSSQRQAPVNVIVFHLILCLVLVLLLFLYTSTYAGSSLMTRHTHTRGITKAQLRW